MSSHSNSKKGYQTPSIGSRDYFKDNLRVLRRNLLFCSGLPLNLTESQLRSSKYFGKYGRVIRVTQLRNVRQMSVYVTYSDAYEASLAIIATNDFEFDRYHRLASIYGTIKYCKYFLKKIQCKNLPNCNYLHVFDKKNEIYINNQLPDEVFDEHYSIAMSLFAKVDVKELIREKKLRENVEGDEEMPCPIETLNRILRDRKAYVDDGRSSSLSENVHDDEASFSDGSGDSEQSCQNSQSASEQGTSETIQLETLEKEQQQFPRIQIIGRGQKQRRKEKYKEKHNREQLKHNHYDKEQKQTQKLVSSRREKNNQTILDMNPIVKSTSPKRSTSPLGKDYALSPSAETLEIKLIRRLLRQPQSRLKQWQSEKQSQQPVEEESSIAFFHKQLSELNELRELCEGDILRERNMEEERVKFLLIKNIHHGRKHCHIRPHQHHTAPGESLIQ